MEEKNAQFVGAFEDEVEHMIGIEYKDKDDYNTM